MASYDTFHHVQITDINGDAATVTVRRTYTDTTTLAVLATNNAALATAVAACTNGKVTQQSATGLFDKSQISAATAPPPASAIYPSVTDGARLSFSGAAGESRALTIPAPLLSDFITGTNTVNPADTNIAALITLIEGWNDEGLTVNLYEGGVKVGKHARRRATRKHL